MVRTKRAPGVLASATWDGRARHLPDLSLSLAFCSLLRAALTRSRSRHVWRSAQGASPLCLRCLHSPGLDPTPEQAGSNLLGTHDSPTRAWFPESLPWQVWERLRIERKKVHITMFYREEAASWDERS